MRLTKKMAILLLAIILILNLFIITQAKEKFEVYADQYNNTVVYNLPDVEPYLFVLQNRDHNITALIWENNKLYRFPEIFLNNDFDTTTRIIQKGFNNYIIISKKGKKNVISIHQGSSENFASIKQSN